MSDHPLVQSLHAAISRRSWNAVEQAANAIRDNRQISWPNAALAQPEAVEPVLSVINPDEWEPCSPAYLTTGGRCDAPRVWNAKECNHWHQKLRPPLAPDGERMRRALERELADCQSAVETIEQNRKPDNETQNGNYRFYQGRVVSLRFALKALSRADEGKESEGCDCGVQRCRDLGCFGHCKPSDPTPPDATAQREAIARVIRGIYGMGHLPFAGGKQDKSIESAADRILALQTRAGG